MVIATVAVPDAGTEAAESENEIVFSWLTAKSAWATAPGLTDASFAVGA
jgi:hypothetical protein